MEFHGTRLVHKIGSGGIGISISINIGIGIGRIVNEVDRASESCDYDTSVVVRCSAVRRAGAGKRNGKGRGRRRRKGGEGNRLVGVRRCGVFGITVGTQCCWYTTIIVRSELNERVGGDGVGDVECRMGHG